MIPFKSVELRFYGDLVDFVAGRQRVLERTFDVAPSVKDMIEACGVPHPEIDLVLIDGVPAGWDHPVADGERISVFPRFRTFDIAQLSPVHVAPLTEPRFVLDGHLGKLARYLRLLGIDAELPADADDIALARVSHRGCRALLTRHIELLKRSIVTHGYFVRPTDALLQCADVVRYFELTNHIAPFTRCMACNGVLRRATEEAVEANVPPRVRSRHEHFDACPDCGRVYWMGSHTKRLRDIVTSVRNSAHLAR